MGCGVFGRSCQLLLNKFLLFKEPFYEKRLWWRSGKRKKEEKNGENRGPLMLLPAQLIVNPKQFQYFLICCILVSSISSWFLILSIFADISLMDFITIVSVLSWLLVKIIKLVKIRSINSEIINCRQFLLWYGILLFLVIFISLVCSVHVILFTAFLKPENIGYHFSFSEIWYLKYS